MYVGELDRSRNCYMVLREPIADWNNIGHMLFEAGKAQPSSVRQRNKRYVFLISTPTGGFETFYTNNREGVSVRFSEGSRRYNGYSNYETWLIACEIDSPKTAQYEFGFRWSGFQTEESIAKSLKCCFAEHKTKRKALKGRRIDRIRSANWLEIARLFDPHAPYRIYSVEDEDHYGEMETIDEARQVLDDELNVAHTIAECETPPGERVKDVTKLLYIINSRGEVVH